MKIRSNITLLLVITISAALILVSGILSVNVTYGRYVTQFADDIVFFASPASEVYVIQLDEEGSRAEFTPQWTTVGGEKCLSFIISNMDCSAESVTDRDMAVRIRVFIPEHSDASTEDISLEADESFSETESEVSAQPLAEESEVVLVNPGNLVFTIKIGSRTEIFESQVDYLSTQTPMYMESENGISGWVYSFYQVIEFENGTVFKSEVSHVLDGGELTDLPVTITVRSLDFDTSDIIVYVDRVE